MIEIKAINKKDWKSEGENMKLESFDSWVD